MRQGLKTLLEKEPDMEVVAEAEDGRRTVSLVKEVIPHVVIMDVNMPDLNGIEASRQILSEYPDVKVIALSMHADRRFVINMLAGGRWLAYSSSVSGRQEVYIRPLGDGGTPGREIPVSTNGGSLGLWEDRVSPPRLTFHSGDEFWAVEVHSAERISAPRPLGSVAEITRKTLMHSHLRDGRWLVALKGEDEELPDRINVELHWTAELEQRLAAQ